MRQKVQNKETGLTRWENHCKWIWCWRGHVTASWMRLVRLLSCSNSRSSLACSSVESILPLSLRATVTGQQCHLVASWKLSSHEKNACVREQGTSLLNPEHTVTLWYNKNPSMLQNKKNQWPLKFFFFTFSSSYIRHNVQRDVPHPCMSVHSRQPKAHVPWEADGRDKALDTKAHLALRRSSSVTVELEQLTTIKQEKRSQETTRGCLALTICRACSFPDLSRCCAI